MSVLSGSPVSGLAVASGQRVAPQQDRARARVQRYLDAAVDVLREGGVDGLTMSRVAQRADSSLPSLYRYFPDRQALVQALAEQYLGAVADAVSSAVAEVTSAAEARTALQGILRGYYEAFRDDLALRHLWMGTLSDPVLSRLNIEDSLRNGRVLAEALAPYSALSEQVLVDRCVLAAQLTLSTVLLCLSLPEADGERMLAEFASWADVLLLPR